MFRTLSLVVSLTLLACDTESTPVQCPPAFALSPLGVCQFSEARVVDIMRTFDQADLVRVNAEPFPQITDPEVLRNVWITPLTIAPGLDTVDLYRLVDPDAPTPLPAAFPVGTVIVHERVDGLEGSTVQVKREPGYGNLGGGPWWFGKFYRDGSPDEADCSPCWACHQVDHRPNEGLWGVPREELAY